MTKHTQHTPEDNKPCVFSRAINAGYAERELIQAVENALEYCGEERTREIIEQEMQRD